MPAENISATVRRHAGLAAARRRPRRPAPTVDPVFPPALEAATNPTSPRMAQTYVACLADHGECVRLLNDENLDWTYRAGHDVPDDNAEIEDACLVGTFGSD